MNDNSFSSQSIRTYRRKKNVGGLIVSILLIVILIAVAAVLTMAIAKIGPFAPDRPSVPSDSDTTETTDGSPNDTESPVGSSEPVADTEPPDSIEPPETNDPNEILYVSVNKEYKDTTVGDLLLIDKDHAYSFPDTSLYSLYDYKSTGSYKISSSKLVLRYDVILQFESMMDALAAATETVTTDEDGNEITVRFDDVQVAGAYRSFETQQANYNANPTQAAKPGCSDYHTGTTLYLNCYTDDGKTLELSLVSEASWLKQNAHKYGFIFRYPANKQKITGYNIPWQIRYVGVAHATYMYENNLCLEEYLELLAKDHAYLTNHLRMDCADGMTYEVFYVQGPEEGVLKLPIPANRDYLVSGDNLGGFIVTVTVGETPTSPSDTPETSEAIA